VAKNAALISAAFFAALPFNHRSAIFIAQFLNTRLPFCKCLQSSIFLLQYPDHLCFNCSGFPNPLKGYIFQQYVDGLERFPIQPLPIEAIFPCEISPYFTHRQPQSDHGLFCLQLPVTFFLLPLRTCSRQLSRSFLRQSKMPKNAA
jgi:hypothetical protein